MPALSVLKNGNIKEAKECIRLLDIELSEDPGNQRIIRLKATIMDVFRAEAALTSALKGSPRADRLYKQMIKDLRVASKISPLTGRANDAAKAEQLRRAAEAMRTNEEARIKAARTGLQKSLNSARSAIPPPEGGELSHVWDKIAKRHKL